MKKVVVAILVVAFATVMGTSAKKADKEEKKPYEVIEQNISRCECRLYQDWNEYSNATFNLFSLKLRDENYYVYTEYMGNAWGPEFGQHVTKFYNDFNQSPYFCYLNLFTDYNSTEQQVMLPILKQAGLIKPGQYAQIRWACKDFTAVHLVYCCPAFDGDKFLGNETKIVTFCVFYNEETKK